MKNQPATTDVQLDNSLDKKGLSTKLSLGIVAMIVVAVSATSSFFMLHAQRQALTKKAGVKPIAKVEKIQPGTIGSIESNIKADVETEQKLDNQNIDDELDAVDEESDSTKALETKYED